MNAPPRGKFSFTVDEVHRLLGLPDEVRVAYLYARHDPDMIHVVVEGEWLPEAEEFCVGVPNLWHPGIDHRVRWGDWVPGMTRADTWGRRQDVVARLAA